MRERRRTSALAVLLTALLALTLSACGGGPSGDDAYHGALLDQPYDVASVHLTGTRQADYDVSAAPDDVLRVVFFGYTKCPDICQVVMSTIASAYTRLEPDQRKHVQVVFVTTDPARDTTAVLRRYVARFHPDFVGATGPLAEIERLAASVHIFLAKGRTLPSGGYEVDHTTSVLADVGGRTRLVWSQDTSPAQMSADMAQLLKDHT